MPKRSDSTPTRRTQEERSAATKLRLLDATIDSLIEDGYSATTTTTIARRAGVSRGAQLHHYPTKADLVAAAVDHLASRLLDRFSDELPRADDADRVRAMVDALASSFESPLLSAWVELSVAARTDAELRATFDPVRSRLQTRIHERVEAVAADEVRAGQTLLVLAMTVCLFEGMTLEASSPAGAPIGSTAVQHSILDAWKSMVREFIQGD